MCCSVRSTRACLDFSSRAGISRECWRRGAYSAPNRLSTSLASGNHQDLAAPHDLVGTAFVSSQRAVEPHDGRIRANEGQFLESFTLNTVAEDRPMYRSVPLFDSFSARPHLTCPQNPNPILVEQIGQCSHVVTVPCFFPRTNEGRDLLPISRSSSRLSVLRGQHGPD